MQDVEAHPDADGGVRQIESRPDERSEVEVEKIDHVPVQNAVDQVADNSSAKESETDLDQGPFEGEVSPKDEDGQQGDHGQQGQPETLAGEQAPGGPGIAHVDDIEEAGNDGDGVWRVIAVEGQGLVYPHLGYLVPGEDQDGDQEEPPIGADSSTQAAWWLVGHRGIGTHLTDANSIAQTHLVFGSPGLPRDRAGLQARSGWTAAAK